ncbi:MAG: hypothetical protein C0621_04490 [Desulfuromonas sp.]|nr:MAG: hypothetical protein C0621_04490 [Desulfuromonas sp.]
MFFLILLLLFPVDAFAWGIGVHLEIGSHMLSQLALFPAEVARVLAAAPYDFLYGCISADITLGKKYTHHLKHCHRWRMGKKILDKAQGEQQLACAYGYLCHLAADTIAHNYFVPFKMVRTFNTVLLNHAYWELRIEAHVDEQIWPLAREVARRNYRENDDLMRSVLSNTLFSFGTNKRIFNSLLLLNRLQQWQKTIRSLDTTSKWKISDEDRKEYLLLAREAALSILKNFEKSPSRKADPAGERALSVASALRSNLKSLWLDGKLPEREVQELLLQFKPRFRDAINQPRQLLDLLSLD